MAVILTDFTCDLDCPVEKENNLPFCCKGCAVSKRKYLTEDLRAYWGENHGFWSKNGCRLPRDKRPQECRDYDCRKYTFYTLTEKRWCGGRWHEAKRKGAKLSG